MNEFKIIHRPRMEESLSVRLKNNTVYVTPSAGGPLVGFILNTLSGYNLTRKDIETIDDQIRTNHRIIESFKYGMFESGYFFSI